jgi:hypothetical protein
MPAMRTGLVVGAACFAPAAGGRAAHRDTSPARGHPTLSLSYFRAPGLPRELVRIPLEFFRRALRWVIARTGAHRVELLGLWVWPSADYTREIHARLTEHGFRFAHPDLRHAAAGHGLGLAISFIPSLDQAHSGGTPPADAGARADLWPRLLAFLDGQSSVQPRR